jgi:hypothetical protein
MCPYWKQGYICKVKEESQSNIESKNKYFYTCTCSHQWHPYHEYKRYKNCQFYELERKLLFDAVEEL